MKRLQSGILASLLLAGSTAGAVETPEASPYDQRIQFVDYNNADVVVVRAEAGLGTRIVFGNDETILDVASGFTQGWEFSDRRNILFIKPRSIKGDSGQVPLEPVPGKWDTNLMVTTSTRLYDFDLRLVSAASRKNQPGATAYRVEFRYPTERAAKAKAQAEQAATRSRLEKTPAPRNWNYSMQVGDNAGSITPTAAYDDGQFIYLTFPHNRDFPAVFVVAPDKTESLVNTHVDKDVLVVQRLAKELVLRLGSAVVAIYNENPDQDNLAPGTGTTVPGVQRVLNAPKENRHD